MATYRTTSKKSPKRSSKRSSKRSTKRSTKRSPKKSPKRSSKRSYKKKSRNLKLKGGSKYDDFLKKFKLENPIHLYGNNFEGDKRAAYSAMNNLEGENFHVLSEYDIKLYTNNLYLYIRSLVSRVSEVSPKKMIETKLLLKNELIKTMNNLDIIGEKTDYIDKVYSKILVLLN